MTNQYQKFFRIWDTQTKRYDNELALDVEGNILESDGRYFLPIKNKDRRFVVQPSTNCIDKNNKKVFIGDILVFSGSRGNCFCEVCYHLGNGVIARYKTEIGVNENKETFIKYNYYPVSEWEFCPKNGSVFSYEVVGNNFENKNLLN